MTSRSNEKDNNNSNNGTPPPMPKREGAIFRSVVMQSGPAPTLFSHHDPEQSKLGLLRVNNTPAAKTAPSHGFDSSSSSNDANNILVDGGNVLPALWKLTDSNEEAAMQLLEAVPMFHLLERTAVTFTHLSWKEIRTRLVDFLKWNNVQARYSEGSPARIDCTTQSWLKFTVQLWKKEDGIVMEVQRRSGCCITMQSIRHELNQAVMEGVVAPKGCAPVAAAKETRAPAAVSNNNHRSISQSMMNEWLDQQLPMDDSDDEEEVAPASSAALSLTQRLLSSPRLDEQRMGMESLTHMTDLNKMIPKEAIEASSLVLTSPEWQGYLLPFLEHRAQPKQEGFDESTGSIQDFSVHMHLLTLQVLVHALDTKTSMGTMPPASPSDPFWSKVLQAAWYNVSLAMDYPMLASWSIRILQGRGIAPIQPQQSQSLRMAQGYGHHHFAHLEQDAQALLSRCSSQTVSPPTASMMVDVSEQYHVH